MTRLTKALLDRNVLAVAEGHGLVAYALLVAYLALGIIVAIVCLAGQIGTPG